MGKWIRTAVAMLMAAVFILSAAYIAIICCRYRAVDRLYKEMAKQFVSAAMPETGEPVGSALSGQKGTGSIFRREGCASQGDMPPIEVDFDGLQEMNEDIVGWLYCEDTPINYPILQGEDNDQYLHHSYDGAYSMAGSIFIEAMNRRNFDDLNTIIYGHHMKDGSMFAALGKWTDQEFYETHPVMWLLTPNRDYRIDLFSAYATSADSKTYTIFAGACEAFDGYLAECARQSAFQADVELNPQARYVVLSTCAYGFDNARNVLHGRMVPVGRPKAGK